MTSVLASQIKALAAAIGGLIATMLVLWLNIDQTTASGFGQFLSDHLFEFLMGTAIPYAIAWLSPKNKQPA